MSFDLKGFISDLKPVMEKHNLSGIVGIAFSYDDIVNVYKLADPYDQPVSEGVNAAYVILNDILEKNAPIINEVKQHIVGDTEN